MGTRSSSTESETTYHSFNDIELYEPSPPRAKETADGSSSKAPASAFTVLRPSALPRRDEDRPATAVAMKRQDSGYESHATASPRSSISRSTWSPPPTRRTSASGPGGVSGRTPRARPPTRRSTNNKSYHHPNSSVHMVNPTSPSPPPAVQPSSYFHFPSPDDADHQDVEPSGSLRGGAQQEDQPTASLPPQTTHYWTSDRTRRLEYAAIDAASRGITGWIRRHLLPDCLAARDGGRHIHFDDDSGSVRRYRLELEDEHHQAEEKSAPPKRRQWQFWK